MSYVVLRVATCFAYLSSQKKARSIMCAEPGMSKVLNSMMRSGHEETQVESATCLSLRGSSPRAVLRRPLVTC